MIYDVIGDIHGHADKLKGLLDKLGYKMTQHETLNISHYQPPPNHRAIFIGDLIDRGPMRLKPYNSCLLCLMPALLML